jgi:hypothetical protein
VNRAIAFALGLDVPYLRVVNFGKRRRYSVSIPPRWRIRSPPSAEAQ